MEFELAVKLLTEYDYKKNGEIETIKFLIYVLNLLANKGSE